MKTLTTLDTLVLKKAAAGQMIQWCEDQFLSCGLGEGMHYKTAKKEWEEKFDCYQRYLNMSYNNRRGNSSSNFLKGVNKIRVSFDNIDDFLSSI